MKRSVKITSLIALWVSLSISSALVHNTVVRIILALVGIGVSIHLLTLKTVPEEAEAGKADDAHETPSADTET